MYQEPRQSPQQTVIEKKVYEEDGGRYRERDTRTRANVGLGFGIAALALSLWNRNGSGILPSIIGGGSNGGGMPTNVNINGGFGGGGGCVSPTPFEVYAKETSDAIELTKAFYNQRIASLQEATAAREVDVREKFGLYINNRDNIDRVNNRLNAELFDLYKYTRDKDDETRKELCDLKAQIAVSSAVRPYQDKLLQNEIATAFSNAINYIDRKTCKMITGTVVVPSTPTITGFGSYCCGNQAAADGGTA